MRGGERRALKLVVRANSRRDTVPVLLKLRERLEELKMLLRLGQDMKAFPNFNSFEHPIGLVVEIAKQNEGWLKSQRLESPGLESRNQGHGRNQRVMPEGLAARSVP